MKKVIISIFMAMMIFLSACGSTSQVSANEATPVAEKSSPVKESKAGKNLYKGAGLVIAVTSPEVRNGGKSESWMPQFFQDSITGNFAKYSKMTVLDRANENLTKAEQELSETGFYTEENAVQLGQMTNAQYAVFGSITTLSSSYELNFRAIDITTNEIKAAYNDRATGTDIENGTSIKEIVVSLFEGLGIQLSEKEKQQLAKTDSKSVNATKSLAKGAAAEKADNLIEALAFYTEAQQNGATKKEASAGINSILGTNGTISGNTIQNLKTQIAQGEEQAKKWSKILTDLDTYLGDNAFMLVYDFSKIELKLDSITNSEISISVAPGVKIVPDRKVLLLAKTVLDEWNKVYDVEENKSWVNNVHNDIAPWYAGAKFNFFASVNPMPKNNMYFLRNTAKNSAHEYTTFGVDLGVYDNNGYRIKTMKEQGYEVVIRNDPVRLSNIKPQKLYFDESQFERGYFNRIKLSEIPDDSDLQIKIEKIGIFNTTGYPVANVRIMSIDEYNEWEKNQ